MPYVDIPFGAFTPDLGGAPNPADPGYLVDCMNLRPTPAGYRGTLTFTDVSSAAALPGTSVDSLGTPFVAIRNDSLYLFVGVDTSSAGNIIAQSNSRGTSWSNVRTLVQASGHVDFAQFDDYVFVAEAGAAPYYKDITTSQATAFSAVPNSPPTATYIARVRDHIVLGALSTDLYSVRWSAIGDPTDWPTPNTSEAASKEAGSQRLPSELGVITRVVGGERFGLIFQQHGITRATYVGGNVTYEFDTYEKRVGMFRSQSPSYTPPIIKLGDLYYWFDMASGGMYATDGYTVRRVSAGVIDEALTIDSISHPDALPSGPSSFGLNLSRNMLAMPFGSSLTLCYDIAMQRFYMMDQSVGVMFNTEFHYDGPRPYIHQISTSGYLQQMTAANAGIGLQTGFIEIDPGYYVQLQGAHLLGTGVPGSLTLAYKAADDYDSDLSVAQTGFTSLTAPGRGIVSSARANAPMFAFRVTGTGAESQLLRGIRVYYERGERVQ